MIIVEEEGGFHIPAYLAADGLFSAYNVPGCFAWPVHDVIQVEVVLTADPHHSPAIQSYRSLSVAWRTLPSLNPDCRKNTHLWSTVYPFNGEFHPIVYFIF